MTWIEADEGNVLELSELFVLGSAHLAFLPDPGYSPSDNLEVSIGMLHGDKSGG